MPKRKRNDPATLYLLRSVDSVTAKPMSIKLGYSTRPIQRRQDELSAAREKFTARLQMHQVLHAQKREKLVKLWLREMAPAKWYYSNQSLEFLHHRAEKLARQLLDRVTKLSIRELNNELRAVEKRWSAHQALLKSSMARDDTKVVHIRTCSGRSPVPNTEALYFPRTNTIFYQGDFWDARQYLQLRAGGTRDAARRLWCFSTSAQPMTNLRGNSILG